MLRKILTVVSLSFAVLAASSPLSHAWAQFRAHGSATVVKGIVAPNQAKIEQQTGLSLAIVQNGSGNGLKDLVAGKADVAMISAPLEVEVALTNKKKPGSLDATGLEEHPVGKSRISFIVNPKNPVKSLTASQLRDIFTGKITSWKEVGGANQPILLVVERSGNGTRANVTASFLNGAEFPTSARVLPAIVQLAKVVAQAPNAISYGNATTITGAVAVVQGAAVDQPLSIVTRGTPSTKAKALIEAVAKHGAAL